jgi:hypothetical protein
MNNDDYGYFGKGTEGYIHYKQTFDESFKNKASTTHQSASTNKVTAPPKDVNKSPQASQPSVAYRVFGTVIFITGMIGFIALVMRLIAG